MQHQFPQRRQHMSAPAQRTQIGIISGPKRQSGCRIPIAINFYPDQLAYEPGAQDLVSAVGRFRACSVFLQHNHHDVVDGPIDRTIRQRAIARCRVD